MDQDWAPTVIRGGAKPKPANRVVEIGAPTEKKYDGGRNVQGSTAVYARKLDEAEESHSLGHVGRDIGIRIMQGRQEKGMTQKQLAAAISEKPQVINDYEAGRGIPIQATLSKIERVLGVRVRPEKPKKGKGRGKR